MSRDLDWGVPVPVDGAEGKVLYVWFDAPIGYISNTQELLPQSWEKWWKSPDTRLVHFIGKDNIVFHCIVFPSMLKAYGDYILPDNVPANEFLNLEGDKISTSRGWAVWVNEFEEQFPGQEDVLRYTLTANAPETKDNDFSWKDFQARNNSELVAIFGNFVNRAAVLTQKYFGGRVPGNPKPEAIDAETLAQIPVCRKALEEYLDGFHFREALKEAMNIARIGNPPSCTPACRSVQTWPSPSSPSCRSAPKSCAVSCAWASTPVTIIVPERVSRPRTSTATAKPKPCTPYRRKPARSRRAFPQRSGLGPRSEDAFLRAGGRARLPTVSS